MKEIWMIVACLPLYVINSFCDKYISAHGGGRGYTYNTFKFLIGAVILLPLFLADPAPRFGAGAVWCGIGCGVLYAISKTVILEGYEKSSVAFMTLCHAAGMILPCVIGHVWWNEPLTPVSLIGILLAVISIVLLKDSGSEKARWQTAGILIGIVVFITSGGVMVLQKLMGLYFADQSVTAYNVYSFAVACLLLVCFAGRERKSPPWISQKVRLACAAGSAVSLCVISVVMTKLSGVVPSVIMFPLFNGLGIIGVCLGSVWAFREKLTPRKLCGLFVGVLGLCLVNL